jgi:transcriptional regulator with XRE-family HTH domain
MFLKFFPPHILKNNFSQPHIGTFAKPHHPTHKPKFCKRANFTHPPDNDNLLKTLKTFSEAFPKDFIFLTKSFKIELFKMDSLGETIRKLREDKELPLRTVAAYLDIDQAILSKIERGQRNASRDQVVKLAEFFKIKETDLLVSWLSDKLVYEVADEDVALKALQVAEEKVKYQKTKGKK